MSHNVIRGIYWRQLICNGFGVSPAWSGWAVQVWPFGRCSWRLCKCMSTFVRLIYFNNFSCGAANTPPNTFFVIEGRVLFITDQLRMYQIINTGFHCAKWYHTMPSTKNWGRRNGLNKKMQVTETTVNLKTPSYTRQRELHTIWDHGFLTGQILILFTVTRENKTFYSKVKSQYNTRTLQRRCFSLVVLQAKWFHQS